MILTTKYIHLLILFGLFLSLEYNWAQSNSPPVIGAIGNEPYCPGTEINIATSVSIDDIDNSGTEVMYVQISQGYENGSDILTLTGLHPNIVSTWNPVSGKLELNSSSGGEVPYSEFIAAIEAVVFNTTNLSTTNDRYFSITWGSANYLPSTGHFYEYYSAIGISWTAAKTAAESLTYFGLQGYLVTILSADEAKISGEQALGTGWIGGSDSQTEGVWKWMTGPENGTIFWNGLANGSTPNFAFWNTGEPNQTGDEDYAHITAPSIGIPGSWNDLANAGDPNTGSAYHPQGYIVEYGGMPGEPPLNISASTSIHIPKITSVTPNERCGNGTITLAANANLGTISWYDTPSGGNLVGTGSIFTTPLLVNSTIYYVSTGISGCSIGVRSSVAATVHQIPTINSTVGDTICTNGNGNLSATASLGSINWYDVPSGGTAIATGNNFTTPNTNTTTTYYVDASTSFCTTQTRTAVTLNVNSPSAPTGDAIQYFCKKDNTIVSNLTTITGNNIVWYDASTGGNSYTGTEPLIDGQIYYASQNDGVCESVNRLQVDVTIYNSVTPLAPESIPSLDICDNSSVGTPSDGFVITDITVNESILLNGENTSEFDLAYFLDSSYSIPTATPPTAFKNTDPGGQTLYVRMTNKLDNTCFSDTQFELQILELPIINSTVTLKNCDEDGNPDGSDGFTDFNLDEANYFITKGDNTINVTYYLTFSNATNNINPIPSFPFNNATANTVYGRAQSTNGCHDVATINLEVSTTFLPPDYLFELSTCDDDDSSDGLYIFDLTQASTDIISQFPSGQNLRVQYYRNLSDAQLEQNEIIPQNAYMSEIPNSQIVYVRVESEDNGDCFGIGPHLMLTVNPRPEFEVIPTAIVCLNLPPITLEAFNPMGTYSYQWTDKNNTVISTTSTVDVSTGGIYTVTATSELNCQSFLQIVTVTESEIATLTYDDISIVDDSSNNTVTINNDSNNLGIGIYEFSLDNENGPYQDESTFEMVAPGIHIIYVRDKIIYARDKNSCGVAELEISVIGFPKFFTPNNDGINDYWKILGVSQDFYPSSIIYIYDRFGKILAKVNPNGTGWDGIYNGAMMPSTDYWFSSVLTANDGSQIIKKGHFSLIRR